MGDLGEILTADPNSSADQVLQLLAKLEAGISTIPIEQQHGGRTPWVGARMCYRNALHLYRCAVSVSAGGDFGTARSIAILSLEEYGKAYYYAMLGLGVYSSDPRDQGHRPYVDRRVFRCHQCKQGLVFAMEIGRVFIPMVRRLAGLENLLPDGPMSADQVADAIERLKLSVQNPPTKERLMDEFKQDPALVESVTKLFSDRAGMERMKESGFYVDFESEPVTSPVDLTNVAFEKVRGFVRSRLVSSAEFFLAEITPESETGIKEALSPLNSIPVDLVCPRSWAGSASHPFNPRSSNSGEKLGGHHPASSEVL